MMLAAAVPSDFAGEAVDFGAGAGAAGLALVARCAGARVVLAERDPEMASFARATLAHENNAGLAGRACVIEADVALSGAARALSGLPDNGFDFVLMNPPFNAGTDHQSPDPLRAAAHAMDPSLWGNWLRSAAAVCRPRGGLVLIARPASLPDILPALRGRFGAVALKALHPRADAPAIRIVLRAVRGARGDLSVHPPLMLHDKGSNRFNAEADRINNGEASLFGD
ncbi:MAG: methyltransferase [Mesorhizobium amorphae]|nr:MAG: methyltransferase [Mesorhizobium amorphae]